MSFRVVVVPKAKLEMEEMLGWVAQRSPAGAGRLRESFERALQSLADQPHLRALAPEAALVNRDVRQILFKTRKGRTYRALFEIHEDEVRVLHVRGPGQELLGEDDY